MLNLRRLVPLPLLLLVAGTAATPASAADAPGRATVTSRQATLGAHDRVRVRIACPGRRACRGRLVLRSLTHRHRIAIVPRAASAPAPTPPSAPAPQGPHRIKADGTRLYDSVTGATFQPRGANYVRLRRDRAGTAYGMRDAQIATCRLGAQGWLVWTWGTHENLAHQPLFFHLDEVRGAINGQLAPIVRPDPCR